MRVQTQSKEADDRSRPILKKPSAVDAKDQTTDINYWVDRYLGVGEYVLDAAVGVASSSGFLNGDDRPHLRSGATS